MKKIATNMVCVLTTLVLSISALAIDATPTTSTVLVDGKEVAFDAFNIEGNNYFKLRDVAYTLSGTSKQFDVGYDVNTNSIFLTSGKAYTIVGGEMELGGTEMSEATSTNQQIVKNGEDIELSAYNIDGSNYFKLRDLGEKFDFSVDYDEESNSVIVDTKKDENKPSNLDENGLATDLFTPAIRPTPAPPSEVPDTTKRDK